MKLLLAIALFAAAISLRWLPAPWLEGAGAFYATCAGIALVVAAFISLGAGLADLRRWLTGKMR